MPLPNILSGKTKRCKAKCKARGDQCRNPAAYGMMVCRYHGARKPETITRGSEHWNFQNAGQTKPERQERHEMAVFFHETEELMFALRMVAPGSTRTMGRKPVKRNA
ncbi:MAG: hypothetical protein RSE16_11015 [Sphingobium sp.]|nr:MAG: hypothetical protein RSE16_11015 [Sphingobium sp.]